ncbi:MerR family transcriptional regulator [Fusobacterium sp. PH5-44]|uniref:MerR family transcriptional regulator n=1 Tax=unclassified Fusobacterium TaxID=2648384 RepID=UPI003D200A0F
MTIGEVSKRFDLPIDTLRYYERIGLIPNVGRNKNGVRDYNEENCGWVSYIKCMRTAGMSIEALIEYVRLYNIGEETIEERKKLLNEQREQIINKLNDLQKTLELLNYKIDNYDEITKDKSKDCSKI